CRVVLRSEAAAVAFVVQRSSSPPGRAGRPPEVQLRRAVRRRRRETTAAPGAYAPASASIGSSRDALRAGMKPNATPMTLDTANAAAMAKPEIGIFDWPATRSTTVAMP